MVECFLRRDGHRANRVVELMDFVSVPASASQSASASASASMPMLMSMSSSGVLREFDRTGFGGLKRSVSNASRCIMPSLVCCCARKSRNGVNVKSGFDTCVARVPTVQKARRKQLDSPGSADARHGATRGRAENAVPRLMSRVSEVERSDMALMRFLRKSWASLYERASSEASQFRQVRMGQPSMCEIRSRCCICRRLIGSVDDGRGFPEPLAVRISKWS